MPFPTGKRGLEKGAEVHLRPNPPGYSVTIHLTANTIQQNRPRSAFGPLFWRILAFSFLSLGTLFVLYRKQALNLTYIFEHAAAVVRPRKCFDYATWDQLQTVPGAYRFHLHTSVTLPMSADVLSFITEGARIHGSLDVSQTADAGSDAVVEVDAFYRNQEDFDEATVCRLRTAYSNEWGLGIFTPAARPSPPGDPFHRLRFEIHLRLPSAPQLTIPQLKTDLNDFSQHLYALAGSVHFNKLALKSTNGRISVDSVAGDKLELQTTNSAILGRFKTTSELDLHSTNGRLDAQISLLPVHPAPRFFSPSYRIAAETSNAALDVTFVDAPTDSEYTLTASARTSNARAEVAMHETFEGAFDLRTTNAGAPAVRERDGVPDPSGPGRRRVSDYVVLEREGRVSGSVWWSSENRKRSRVSVWTSNAQLQLTV